MTFFTIYTMIHILEGSSTTVLHADPQLRIPGETHACCVLTMCGDNTEAFNCLTQHWKRRRGIQQQCGEDKSQIPHLSVHQQSQEFHTCEADEAEGTCGSCRSRPQCFYACTPSSWWSPAGWTWCHHLKKQTGRWDTWKWQSSGVSGGSTGMWEWHVSQLLCLFILNRERSAVKHCY